MKTFWILLMSLSACQLFSQVSIKTDNVKNEMKVNALYLPGGYAELSYERIIGDKSAIGLTIGGFIIAEESNYVTDILTYDFAVLPYYRYYLGRKLAAGFFFEANSLVFSRDSFDETDKETGLGIGLAVGAKFMVRKNWSLEIVAGGGWNLNEDTNTDTEGYFSNFPDVYPRLGITVGKRF
ncbi:porin family protein [Maribacter algarum]|uniref:Porin family protein n=1 Tax=Maribacter algarum (ex Zhang et al. 2020) TaxID=2578118 RepID=A0A5S3PTA7_9FLAO|nr:DUF3575 domain-containing protein [Maribacter algarum]TMM58183.1 porin family protein [Maribacter algarum]